MLEKLGAGTYGDVFKGVKICDQSLIAIKRSNLILIIIYENII